jgi:glycosyltransferase involved in cell wall biosynthesis
MKLAIVVTHPIQYYTPVFELLAKEIDLMVFYTNQKKYNYDKEFNRSICWDIPLLANYKHEFTQPDTIIRKITAFTPDYLLVYGWAPKGHLKLLRHFKGKIKILFRGDSTLLKKVPSWKSVLKEILLKWVYTHVDVAYYTGSNNREYFIKYGIKEDKLLFLPHAIDNVRFATPQSNTDIRKNLNIDPEEILILFTGKFNSNKNVLLLLKAFVEINLANTHLLFVGGGILEQSLIKAAKKHPNVHVVPFQNQQIIPAYYQACDLFCLPSKNESWGLSINEAMACGKAVLVSDQCGAATDLINRKSGKIFKSNDVEDLKTKLKDLLNNHFLRKNAGIHAKNIIREWNFEIQVENIIKSLQR